MPNQKDEKQVKDALLKSGLPLEHIVAGILGGSNSYPVLPLPSLAYATIHSRARLCGALTAQAGISSIGPTS